MRLGVKRLRQGTTYVVAVALGAAAVVVGGALNGVVAAQLPLPTRRLAAVAHLALAATTVL